MIVELIVVSVLLLYLNYLNIISLLLIIVTMNYIKGWANDWIINKSKWNKPSSSSDSLLSHSLAPTSRPDLDKYLRIPLPCLLLLLLLLLHVYAISLLVTLELASQLFQVDRSMDGPKVHLSLKVRQLTLSLTPKSPNKVPLNAAHATRDPNPLNQAPKRPDTTIFPEVFKSPSQSNGLNQVTPLLHPQEKPKSNPPAKIATPTTPEHCPPMEDASPFVLLTIP